MAQTGGRPGVFVPLWTLAVVYNLYIKSLTKFMINDKYVCIQVLVRGVVFARMSPEQKQQLVEAMQEIG